MSEIRVSDTRTDMVGRPLLWPDKIVAPLPAGSKARINAVLHQGEDKTDFLRAAVERELQRRERDSNPNVKSTKVDGD